MTKDWPYEMDPQVLPLPSPSRRSTAIVLAPLALVLVVFGVGWVTNPGAMAESGSLVRAKSQPGTPYVFASVAYPREPVTIRELTPRISGAPTKVKFSGCILNPDYGVGLSDGSITQVCARTRPAEGLTVGPRNRWLVVAEVTQLEAGVVTVRGFDVSYRQGWRFDRQHTGMMLFMHTEGYEPPDR